MRKVEIIPKLNGWEVKVGCEQVVFQDKDEMLKEIGKYIDSPEEIEELYLEKAKNERRRGGLTFSAVAIGT